MPLAEVLAAEVFGPAAMTDTAYPGAKKSLTADGYSTLWAGPAGAVWSTARDLDKFLAALLNTTLLTARDQAIMRQVTLITPQPPWLRPATGWA
jgi:CubicO group peptidase (beta-lactamase class C family)